MIYCDNTCMYSKEDSISLILPMSELGECLHSDAAHSIIFSPRIRKTFMSKSLAPPYFPLTIFSNNGRMTLSRPLSPPRLIPTPELGDILPDSRNPTVAASSSIETCLKSYLLDVSPQPFSVRPNNPENHACGYVYPGFEPPHSLFPRRIEAQFAPTCKQPSVPPGPVTRCISRSAWKRVRCKLDHESAEGSG